MGSTRVPQGPLPRGHVVIYAENERRRNAIVRAAARAGHTVRDCASAQELQRLLAHLRFDVGIWVLRNEQEAEDLAACCAGEKLPLHTIVVGAAPALRHIGRKRGGSLRFVPTSVKAAEIVKVAGSSIANGTWNEESPYEAQSREQFELESIIESAAASVYERAKERRQRFSTVVAGADSSVVGSRSKLRQIFTSLLSLVVDLAPIGSDVTTHASQGDDGWHINVAAASGHRRTTTSRANDLLDEEEALGAVSEHVRDQGGILWVDLAGPDALSVSFTLPLPAEAMQHA